MREFLDRLREGMLSGNQAEALLKHRKQVLKKEREDAQFAGLTEDQRQSIKEAREIETKEKRLTELGSEAVTLAKSAAEKLKMGKAALATFLSNKGVIPPQGPPSCRDFAKTIVGLIDDEGERLCMGKFGRARVEEELAWSHQKRAYVGVYDKLTGGAKADD